MQRVKFFDVQLPDFDELEREINKFLYENNYILVDVKTNSMVTVMESHMLIVTVIYKESDNDV